MNLQNEVILCGSTDNMEEKMLNASIYAMTSLTECFPMVLLESLSCGLPVISFDCPNGPRNIIINNKDGLLVKNNNIDAFAIALIIKRFESKIVMKIWEKLFNNMIHNAI